MDAVPCAWTRVAGKDWDFIPFLPGGYATGYQPMATCTYWASELLKSEDWPLTSS